MTGVFRLFVLAAVAAVGLSACSSVPDAVNPVEWYKGAKDTFSDKEDKGAEAQPANAKAEARKASMDKVSDETNKRDFPTLESVPKSTLAADSAPKGGLAGDSAGRRYASDPIMKQGEAVSALDSDGVAELEKRAQAAKAASAPAPATAPASVAASPRAPAPAPQAQMAPAPKAMSVEEAYRAALAQTRPYQQQGGGAMPAAGMAGGDDGPVVIGGGGLEGGAAVPAAVGGLPQAGMVRVATIQFGNGSSSLDDEDRRVLRQVRGLQRQHGGRLHVIGHSSSHTRSMSVEEHQRVNQRLSMLRAEAVAQALVAQGAGEGTVSTEARGDAEPVFYEVMPTGEAGNRRAEVFLAY